MVFEELLTKIGKRKVYSFFLGILYVFISYGTAHIFFPQTVSLVMVFFTTLLLVPSAGRLISLEERIERHTGLQHFFANHKTLMEVFLFLFLGIFIGYLVIGSYSENTLTYQQEFLAKQGITGDFVDLNIERSSQFTGIVSNNVSVIVIAFVLSIFYGVGALYLIVLNASVFAQFIIAFSKAVSQATSLSTAIFSVHFIPEVFGFLLAAIAGGVISKAIVREKIGTSTFQNVVKDGTVLLGLSIIVIVLAAALETFVTPSLLASFLKA